MRRTIVFANLIGLRGVGFTRRRVRSCARVGGNASRFVCVVLLTRGAGAAKSAEVAEAPSWRVGDQWKYHETTDVPRSERKWGRTITAVSPTGGYTAIRGDGVAVEFDAAGNEVGKRGPERTDERRKFPMSVGSKWTYERLGSMMWGKMGPQEVLVHATWEVKAFEKIAVPAGDFDCFRVSGVTWWASGTLGGQTTTTYWYCPSIRGVAKSEEVKQSRQARPVTTTVSELVSFREGP